MLDTRIRKGLERNGEKLKGMSEMDGRDGTDGTDGMDGMDG